jgi:hypothetical protein
MQIKEKCTGTALILTDSELVHARLKKTEKVGLKIQQHHQHLACDISPPNTAIILG